MPYDFVAYEGASTELNGDMLRTLGFGASVVLHLTERIPVGAPGHSLFFDNYFTTYKILEILRNKGIAAAGTMSFDFFTPTSAQML